MWRPTKTQQASKISSSLYIQIFLDVILDLSDSHRRIRHGPATDMLHHLAEMHEEDTLEQK